MIFYKIRSKYRRFVINFYHRRYSPSWAASEQSMRSRIRRFTEDEIEETQDIINMYFADFSDTEELREEDYERGSVVLHEPSCEASSSPVEPGCVCSCHREPPSLPLLKFLKLGRPLRYSDVIHLEHPTTTENNTSDTEKENVPPPPPTEDKDLVPGDKPRPKPGPNGVSLNAALISSGLQPRRINSVYSSDFTSFQDVICDPAIAELAIDSSIISAIPEIE